MKKATRTRLASFMLVLVLLLQALPLMMPAVASETATASEGEASVTKEALLNPLAAKDVVYGEETFTERRSAKEDYDAYYVQGWTTKWDGFSLQAGKYLSADDKAIFGSTAVIAHDGALYVPSENIDMSSLLPSSDYTFDATVALRESKHYNESNSLLYIGALSGSRVFAELAVSTTNQPIDQSFGQISSTYTAMKGPLGNTVQIATDVYWNDVRFLGARRGEIYSFSAACDYDSTSAFLTLTRDGMTVGGYNLAFPLLYTNGNTADHGKIVIPSELRYDFYALRIYDRALSAEELRLNHFIDLCKWFGISLDVYDTYTEAEKDALHLLLREETFETLTAEMLQATVNAYGTFGESFDAESVLVFDGFQGKLVANPGIRSIYTVNTDAIKALEDKGYAVTVGALMAIKNGRDVYDITLGSANSSYTTVYKNKSTVAEKVLSENDGGFTFGYTTVFDSANSANYYKENLVFRGYVTLEKDGKSYTYYVDADSELLGGTAVSAFKLSTLLAFLGYTDRSTVKTVAGDKLIAAAEKYGEGYRTLLSIKERARAIADGISDYRILALLARAEALTSTGVTDGVYSFDDASYYYQLFNEQDAVRDLPYQTKMTALLQCEDAMTSALAAKDAVNRLYSELSALQTQFASDKSALTSGQQNDMSGDTNAITVTTILNTSLKAVDQILSARMQDLTLEKNVLNTITSGSFQTKMTKLQALHDTMFTKKDVMAFDTAPLSSYVIVSDKESAIAAKKIRAALTEKYGIFLPLLTDAPASAAEGNVISVTRNGNLDGYMLKKNGGTATVSARTVSGVLDAASLFLSELTGDTVDLRAQSGEENAPLFDTDMPAYLSAIDVSALEDGGVKERFERAVSELPEELAVVQPLSSSAFPNSVKNTFYVSPEGNDLGRGTLADPYATLARALDAARALGGAQIVLRGGTHVIDETAVISSLHSGRSDAPLYITAAEGEDVVLTSADVVRGSDFTRVSDASVIARLNTFTANNAQNVYVADLAALGITEYAQPTVDGEPLLTRGNTTLTLARYPNASDDLNASRTPLYTAASDILKQCKTTNNTSSNYAQYNSASDGWKLAITAAYKSRAAKWQSENVWLFGALYEEWHRTYYPVTVATEGSQLTLSSSVNCEWGLKYKSTNDGYFFNILEELDADGEWYLDTDSGKLYVYSSKGISAAETFSCVFGEHPLLRIDEASNVVLNGIHFDRSLASAIIADECEYLLVQNCDFSNIRATAVDVQNARNCGVIGSSFRHISTAMITLAGRADEIDMLPDHNFIQNCSFTDPVVQQALTFSGRASLLSHNYFEYMMISIGGLYDSVIEYNEFVGGSQTISDSGPIYSGGIGTKNAHIRYNYLHDLSHSTYGIYLDDLSAATYVYSNVIAYKEGVNGRCVNIHGGVMNVVYGNLCVAAGTAIGANNPNYYAPSFVKNGQQTSVVPTLTSTGGVLTTTNSNWSVGALDYRWTAFLTRCVNAHAAREGMDSSFRDRFENEALYLDLLTLHNSHRFEDKDFEGTKKVWSWTQNSGTKYPWGDCSLYEFLTMKEHKSDLELFLRSPVYTLIESNVFLGCTSEFAIVTEWAIMTLSANNNYSLTGTSSSAYQNAMSGNLAAITDASVWQSLAPGFKTINDERLGMLTLSDVTVMLPSGDEIIYEEDFDINIGFDDLK